MDKRKILRKKLMRQAKKRIEKKFSGAETEISRSVALMDDLDSSINLLSESFEDWKKKGIENKQLVQTLEENILTLKKERKEVNEFIETEIKKELPNFCDIATPIITARMLSTVGSKKRLALIPASTIQMLGAEKALFKYIKNKRRGKGPKHGFLFNHPEVQKLSKTERGKKSRQLANELALAARKDYFSKE